MQGRYGTPMTKTNIHKNPAKPHYGKGIRTAILLIVVALASISGTLQSDANATANNKAPRTQQCSKHSSTRACVIKRVSWRCHKHGPSISVCRALAAGALNAKVPARWAYDPAAIQLLRHESGWDPNAVNDTSEACGLFQRLVRTGCPWPVSGVGTPRERVHYPPALQAADGWRYIKYRPGYGTPGAAWGHFLSHGWY